GVGRGVEAHATGARMMRHVFLEHRDRADWADVDDAFYLGPALLAAPVVKRGARTRDVELPPGLWLDWRDAKLLQGGAKVTLDAPLAKLPLLLRDGQLVPLLDASMEPLFDASDVVGPSAVADVYDVVGLVSQRAAFGSQLAVVRSGAFAPPAGFEAVDDPSACARCYRVDDLGGGLLRLRLTTSGADDVVAGGITLTQHARPRTRWDLYLP